jgi:hypothetical protein
LADPEAALETLRRHGEDMERYVGAGAPSLRTKYYIYRLEWLMAAAVKVDGDEEKRGAYVAEARGLMGRATQSLRGLRSQDWDPECLVSASASSGNAA